MRFKTLARAAIASVLLVVASNASAQARYDADADLVERTTAFAVFVFFSQCAALFGDHRAISPKVLAELKAEALGKDELFSDDVVGWRLRGPKGERLILRQEEPGHGCHIEARNVDPGILQQDVADMLQIVSARRSVPHRLLSEKRFEIRSKPAWRRTYLMSEPDTPTIAIMVTTSEGESGGSNALLTYMFVSDPY